MKFLITPAFLFLTLFSYGQSVSPTALNYASPSTGTKTFNIVCAATSTWFVSAPAWISVDQVSGQGPTTITVNVQDNESFTQPKSDDIYVRIQLTSITVDRYVTITQAASTPTTPTTPVLTLSTTYINLSDDSPAFTFTSDNSWTASMDSWLGLILNQSNLRTNVTGDITSGNAGTINLNVVAEPNPTTSARTGTITFTSGSVSKSLTVTQDGATLTTGILGDVSTESNHFIVYPNPSAGIIHFRCSNKINITIYDINGSILNSFDADEINTLELNPGLYFIVVDQNGLRSTQKLVVE